MTLPNANGKVKTSELDEFEINSYSSNDEEDALQPVRDKVTGQIRVKRPGSLFNSHSWHLFTICSLVGVQASLTIGFMNSTYSTLERAYDFTATFTGLIEGSFHIAILIIIIPVSLYGRQGNKPLILSIGAGFIALGALTFGSAELFRPNGFHMLNSTLSTCDSKETSGHDAKWLFVLGMFLVGVGSAPIQTVAVAYLDKNSSSTGSSLGWFYAAGLIAPALGFVANGIFLSIPINFRHKTMESSDDRFIGAWILGFLLEGVIALILVPTLLTLPNDKPRIGNKSNQMGYSNQETAKKSSEWCNFKRCLGKLLRDRTYVCLIIHGTLVYQVTAGLSTFMPMFLEAQYKMTPQTSAFAAGGVSVPAAMIGALMSGYIIKKKAIDCYSAIKMTFFAHAMAVLLSAVFMIIICPEDEHCAWRIPGLVFFFLAFLAAAMMSVPKTFALLRLVQEDWRTISLGVQWVFFRLFGMIPGPLIFGKLFDYSCIEWGSTGDCQEDSAKHCTKYDSVELRNVIMCFSVGIMALAELSLLIGIWCYGKDHAGPGKEVNIRVEYDSESEENIKFKAFLSEETDT